MVPSNFHPLDAGDMMPDFTFTDQDGNRVELSSLRGQSNLIVVFTGSGNDGAVAGLLDTVNARWREFEAENTRIALVVPDWQQAAGLEDVEAPFTILLDKDSAAHRRVGAIDENLDPTLVVFITDRFGEIYDAARPGDAAWPPAAEALLDWVRFIEIQCPE